MIKIAPSILSADFANLHQEVLKLENAGADMIHIDVMDGHFVPNLTFGSMVIKALRKNTSLPLDVHLMIDHPERSIETYIDAGADIITIHYETTNHIDRLLTKIKDSGVKVGMSLLPSTSPDIIDYIIHHLDLILVMTVNPGFGGQKFMTNQLQKIRVIRQKIKNSAREITLSVDGGINDITAKDCIEAGANMLVSGKFIFQDSDYKKQIETLKNIKIRN